MREVLRRLAIALLGCLVVVAWLGFVYSLVVPAGALVLFASAVLFVAAGFLISRLMKTSRHLKS